MENLSPNRIVAIQELLKGKEFAAQLDEMLQENTAAGGLIRKVMSSFTRVLNVLDSEESVSVDQDPSCGLVCSEEGRSEVCSKKRKSSSVLGRDCSRRRRQGGQLRTVVSDSMNDEYLWRKYGQKRIHSSKCPRSYYRCTNKYDQNCQAIKQVQKSEHDESVYLITYIGEHTCRGPTTTSTTNNNIPNLIINSNNTISEPSLISFGSNLSNISQEVPFLSPPLFSQRQECEEVHSKPNPYQGSVPSNRADETSGLNSPTQCFEMRYMVDSLGIGGGIFDFQENDFFSDFDLISKIPNRLFLFSSPSSSSPVLPRPQFPVPIPNSTPHRPRVPPSSSSPPSPVSIASALENTNGAQVERSKHGISRSRDRSTGSKRSIMHEIEARDLKDLKSPDLTMDNPLSQNPESTWGRFFPKC